jgi:hypothetical protein
VAYVRRKTVKGKTYCYLVKSVREGKRVRQVFVSYIGNPPPAAHRPFRDEGAQAPDPLLSVLPDFTPLTGANVRERYIRLLHCLGCPSVVFSLRASHKHGDVQAWRNPETGQVSIARVRLHRDASAHAMAHEVGHVLDYMLQNARGSGGSRDAGFIAHTETLRKLADYTCAHHESGSPDAVRRLKRQVETPSRRRHLRYLTRYYERYVYGAEELWARLVAVSFTEPDKARAIASSAYGWLQETLAEHGDIRAALCEAGLWPVA